MNRGKITAKDLTKVTTAEECAQLIIKWAEEVYHSWNSNHGTVSQIAEGFLLTITMKQHKEEKQ